MFKAVLLGIVLLAGLGCAGRHTPTVAPASQSLPATEQVPALKAAGCPLCLDPNSPEIKQAYAQAVENAKYPEPSKISRDLTPLVRSTPGLQWHEENGRILMVTWTQIKFYQNESGEPQYGPEESFRLYGDTWFTAVPFVRTFCQTLNLDAPMLTLRLEQLLGLPPNNGKDAFLEVWVDPADLFRPCPDPAISDHECQVDIPSTHQQGERPSHLQPWDCTARQQVSEAYVEVNEKHLQWMCDNWNATYADSDPLKNYPWTALGYTYDWGDPIDPRGQSEYIAPGYSQVLFQSITPTEEYCKIKRSAGAYR
jgi:hypothetical protein